MVKLNLSPILMMYLCPLVKSYQSNTSGNNLTLFRRGNWQIINIILYLVFADIIVQSEQSITIKYNNHNIYNLLHGGMFSHN